LSVHNNKIEIDAVPGYERGAVPSVFGGKPVSAFASDKDEPIRRSAEADQGEGGYGKVIGR
jgi:hypothetical protein